MSSITAKILTKLNADDFHIGMLSTDNADRAALVKVKPEDIDTLIDNLHQLKTYIADLHEHKQANARKLLESIISESSDFGSVEELLHALGTSQPAPTSTSTKATGNKPNGNKTYEVVIFDQEKDERRTYSVTNKVLPKALEKDTVYQELIKKNKELNDIDQFLRAYSPDYAEAYPINAKWKKATFHLNSKGRLNAQSAKYFEEYQKEHPDSDEKAFKQLVTESYKKV
ncbi:hypothetical protein PVD82_005054 [Enterobacter hormaechei]|nr:hypothetical protein [Enterobacter hormaechei]EKM7551630.1 hypothetical protein [Enterobacter hormaechei]EKV5294918.1 hypothetical protein [Enterobacter hormaechei]EKW8463323.1 hypothetical protein [Enterobacter hormaechei]